MAEKFRVLIPAGGRSSRSGLSYPKTLYRLKGVPILIRILQLLENYDLRPVIAINPTHQALFEDVLTEFEKQAEFVFQNEPRGMGDAVLRANSKIDDEAHVILVWSDIPMLNSKTVDNLIKCHLVSKNNFSLVTNLGANCYTIVEREEGRLKRVLETKALGMEPAKEGERDIGLFVFKKQPTFKMLQEDAVKRSDAGAKEHGFLYLIEKLALANEKVEGYPIALPNDVLSFNTPDDLRQIEEVISVPVSH